MDELRETAAEYAAAQDQPSLRMTVEEFLEWGDEDTWAEWVDGEVIVLSPATTFHQKVKIFLVELMGVFARRYQSGDVLDAPFAVRLPERLRRVREPDIIFVRREQVSRLKKAFFEGGPDVVVEIVSPDSRTRDRRDKYGEYEAAEVGEYWLIDPERRKAEFFRLGADGRFYPETLDAQGIFRSKTLPGFWLNTGWLWQDPLPAVEDIYVQDSAGYGRLYGQGKRDAARQFLAIRFGRQSADIQEIVNDLTDLDTLNYVVQELFSAATLQDARNMVQEALRRRPGLKNDG
ncbi:MAG: Uma2 family endonuclease [Peptococcaceae bacterium]|jgi:Uma2 family endonuclease|nr:Uma2 family endonuclease [Peptococcaceae bacterium]